MEEQLREPRCKRGGRGDRGGLWARGDLLGTARAPFDPRTVAPQPQPRAALVSALPAAHSGRMQPAPLQLVLQPAAAAFGAAVGAAQQVCQLRAERRQRGADLPADGGVPTRPQTHQQRVGRLQARAAARTGRRPLVARGRLLGREHLRDHDQRPQTVALQWDLRAGVGRRAQEQWTLIECVWTPRIGDALFRLAVLRTWSKKHSRPGWHLECTVVCFYFFF